MVFRRLLGMFISSRPLGCVEVIELCVACSAPLRSVGYALASRNVLEAVLV